MTVRSTSKVKRPVLLRASYRSRLEDRIATQLEEAGVPFDYEGYKIKYQVPARNARYTPDFPLGPKGNPTIIIEAKGRFRTTADRQKLALVKEQHPDLDLRLIFQNANLPIYKGSPTTYAMWADSHGFKYADKGKVPEEWLSEIKT